MSERETAAARTARWRAQKIAAGLCLMCGRRKVVAGMQKCGRCRQYWRLAKRLYALKYAGLPPEEVLRAKKAWQTFNEICMACGLYQCCGTDWAFDHDHATLQFRGIIGKKCNTILGFMNDSIDMAGRYRDYLMRPICG